MQEMTTPPWKQLTELLPPLSIPSTYNPPIGLIGCGGITVEHLRAYRSAGLNVVALCDLHRERAEQRRSEFYPEATIYTDHRDLLRDDSIEVVDIATHPADRVPIIRHALEARKHVLSQKPFVIDLDIGEELVALADQQSVTLAVNQNGRFAPHFHLLRHVVASGLLGETFSAHLRVHWDHTWTRGTPFEKIKHLVLYDFGIHWFDIIRCLLPNHTPTRVFATTSFAPSQNMMPPMLAQALIEYPDAQASLAFDAALFGEPLDESFIGGTQGSALSTGPDLLHQSVSLRFPQTRIEPKLQGCWFPDAFRGTMVELLNSIAERRPCLLAAQDNLRSLELCFAAVASAERGVPIKPGSIRKLMMENNG